MNTETRKYTKRGTTIPGKRVVLMDGVPVGRGRPLKDGKGKRTVVFIPVGTEYNVDVHGPGKVYHPTQHGVIKRLKTETPLIDIIVPETPQPVVNLEPTAPVEAPKTEQVTETESVVTETVSSEVFGAVPAGN